MVALKVKVTSRNTLNESCDLFDSDFDPEDIDDALDQIDEYGGIDAIPSNYDFGAKDNETFMSLLDDSSVEAPLLGRLLANYNNRNSEFSREQLYRLAQHVGPGVVSSLLGAIDELHTDGRLNNLSSNPENDDDFEAKLGVNLGPVLNYLITLNDQLDGDLKGEDIKTVMENLPDYMTNTEGRQTSIEYGLGRDHDEAYQAWADDKQLFSDDDSPEGLTYATEQVRKVIDSILQNHEDYGYEVSDDDYNMMVLSHLMPHLLQGLDGDESIAGEDAPFFAEILNDSLTRRLGSRGTLHPIRQQINQAVYGGEGRQATEPRYRALMRALEGHYLMV